MLRVLAHSRRGFAKYTCGLEFTDETAHVRFNNHDPQRIFRLAPLKCERAVLYRYLPLLEVFLRCESNRSLLVCFSTW